MLKILLWILLGGVGLAAAGFIAIQLLLIWAFRTQTYDATDSEFASTALPAIESIAGAALPRGVRIDRYVRMPNFNDGSELWEIVIEDPAQVSEVLTRLELNPVAADQQFPRLDEPSSRVPHWVERPSRDMKWLYVLNQTYCPVPRCNPIHYLWSSDGERFFLYRITF